MTDAQRQVDDVCRHNLVIGEPGECLEQITGYSDLGVRHIACLTSFGAPPAEVARRSIRLLGEEVIPRLGDQ
jgi:alkanesulfonate monooxygenase SsuD/methylene tetrahydromethanopterin reductase-like flavin-dependent oxidoreductase (luciferase family)